MSNEESSRFIPGRTKLTVLLMLLLAAAVYFFTGSVSEISKMQPEPPPAGNDAFILGAMNSFRDYSREEVTDPDKFGMNLWHRYSGSQYDQATDKYYPKGWSDNDLLLAGIGDYYDDVTAILDSNEHAVMKTLMQRPKIEWLCYGQRSDYQCEEESNVEPNYWFYTFQRHETGRDIFDNTQYGENQWVRYCRTANSTNQGNWTDQPDTVAARLIANNEQSDGWTTDYYNTKSDTRMDWLIKPKIRIDSTVAHSSQNPLVCKIDVYDQNGYDTNNPSLNRLKSTDIYAQDFLVDGGGLYYNGRYIEEFNFTGGRDLTIHGAWSNTNLKGARGREANDSPWPDLCKSDIRVYWYGNVDMWIDYVRVDNEIADRLLKPGGDDQFELWLQWEAGLANYAPNAFKFYIEEFEFNNVPCIGYVNQYLDSHTTNHVGMMTCFYWDLFSRHLNQFWYREKGKWTDTEKFDKEILHDVLMEPTGMDVLFTETYPFTSQNTQLPSSLNTSGNCVTGSVVSPAVYDQWLQTQLDYPDYPLQPSTDYSDAGWQGWTLRLANDYSKTYGKPFINMPQTHLWHNYNIEVRREPSVEETMLQSNISLSYGAKGLIFFFFGGWGSCGSNEYGYGYLDNEDHPYNNRDANVYSQMKWDSLISLHKKINKLAPFFYSFNPQYTSSYTYQLERTNLLSQTYFNDIYTYKTGSGQVNCTDEFPDGESSPSGLIGECREDRYVQAAVFKNTTETNPNYFMIVNRRCSPYKNESSEDNRGGKRVIKIVFDASHANLAGFNNWNIYDVTNLRTPFKTFNKTQNTLIDLGWFMPAEGRLYKLVPVIKSGGNFEEAENVSGGIITCEDTVFTNGYNLTVDNNTTILFTDTSNFVFQGGSFTMGNSLYSGVPNISCGAASGNEWNGFVFDSCEVRIYNSTFSGFGSDTSYALNMIDCPLIDIRNNAFSNSQNSTLGAVNVTFYDIDSINNVYIENNTFELTNSVVPAVNILSYAGITTPLIIENNIFSSNTDNSTAILLSGITGGAIKSNTFTNFHIGLNLLSSSIDVSENTISSSLENAIGILAVSGSEIKMNPSGELQLGGMNNISCTETGSINIKVDNSYFNMDYGENIFNIAELNYSYHMNGWFDPFLQVSTNARENCFKLQDQPYAPPIENLKWGKNGSDIEFVFSPYLTGCIPEGCETYYIVDLGHGLYDTICVGGGFGMLDNKEHELTTGGVSGTNISPYRGETQRGVIILSPKQAYDSLCIYMRLRNYAQAKNKCYELINNYPDSLQSVNAINKLFLSVTATDASQNGVSQLKIYFETLILNHSGNTALVKRCNYFVQKCKVRMRQYSSALTGFQQIITQNPASYEGLVARWDYMATSLLMHGGGTGGFPGISDFGIEIAPAFRDLKEEAYKAFEFDESDKFDKFDKFEESDKFEKSDESDKFDESDESFNDDRNPFTREEKKAIRNAVNNVLNTSRENNDKRIEIITREADNGNNNAKRELEHINKMKEVVKTQRPKNVIEHIKIINSDIQKIFGGKSSNNKPPQNNIPVVYRLAQNYPNPFNPITTIKYEIPKDSKVKLVVYDLLGREIKTLVNNEIKSAGYYKLDFNMQNYASGVYFYRIEADDTKGNKFVDAKKMVLVK